MTGCSQHSIQPVEFVLENESGLASVHWWWCSSLNTAFPERSCPFTLPVAAVDRQAQPNSVERLLNHHNCQWCDDSFFVELLRHFCVETFVAYLSEPQKCRQLLRLWETLLVAHNLWCEQKHWSPQVSADPTSILCL